MRGRARGALRGTVPALAEEALGRISVRAAARGNGFVHLQGSLRPGSAAARVASKKVHCRPGLLTRRPVSAHERMGMRGRARGALRGTVPTFAEEALGRISVRAAARGNEVFASNARYGPFPLPLGLPRKRSLVGRVSRPGVRFQPMSGWGCVGEVVGRSGGRLRHCGWGISVFRRSDVRWG